VEGEGLEGEGRRAIDRSRLLRRGYPRRRGGQLDVLAVEVEVDEELLSFEDDEDELLSLLEDDEVEVLVEESDELSLDDEDDDELLEPFDPRLSVL
jgi:hypothetical protein